MKQIYWLLFYSQPCSRRSERGLRREVIHEFTLIWSRKCDAKVWKMKSKSGAKMVKCHVVCLVIYTPCFLTNFIRIQILWESCGAALWGCPGRWLCSMQPQSLLFKLSVGNARARERWAAKARDARNECLQSRAFRLTDYEKRETAVPYFAVKTSTMSSGCCYSVVVGHLGFKYWERCVTTK